MPQPPVVEDDELEILANGSIALRNKKYFLQYTTKKDRLQERAYFFAR